MSVEGEEEWEAAHSTRRRQNIKETKRGGLEGYKAKERSNTNSNLPPGAQSPTIVDAMIIKQSGACSLGGDGKEKKRKRRPDGRSALSDPDIVDQPRIASLGHFVAGRLIRARMDMPVPSPMHR
jgi:hypothetical protein